MHLLSHPPTEDKYMAIKTRLLKTFGLTRRVHANKILNKDDLGDGMPSALMDEMLSLLDNHQPCMLFEQIFLNWMPDSICLQLADAVFKDPQVDGLWLSTDQNSSCVIRKVIYSC